MLATSAAAAHAAWFTHDFPQEPADVVGQSQKMAVTSMIAVDQIARTQRFADSNPGKFLPDAGVDRADQFSFGKKIEKLLLDRTNRHRSLVEAEVAQACYALFVA